MLLLQQLNITLYVIHRSTGSPCSLGPGLLMGTLGFKQCHCWVMNLGRLELLCKFFNPIPIQIQFAGAKGQVSGQHPDPWTLTHNDHPCWQSRALVDDKTHHPRKKAKKILLLYFLNWDNIIASTCEILCTLVFSLDHHTCIWICTKLLPQSDKHSMIVFMSYWSFYVVTLQQWS